MPTILDLAIEDFDKQIADLQRKRALIVRRRDNPDAEYTPLLLLYFHEDHEWKGKWQAHLHEDYVTQLRNSYASGFAETPVPIQCSPTFNIPRVPKNNLLMTLI